MEAAAASLCRESNKMQGCSTDLGVRGQGTEVRGNSLATDETQIKHGEGKEAGSGGGSCCRDGRDRRRDARGLHPMPGRVGPDKDWGLLFAG